MSIVALKNAVVNSLSSDKSSQDTKRLILSASSNNQNYGGTSTGNSSNNNSDDRGSDLASEEQSIQLHTQDDNDRNSQTSSQKTVFSSLFNRFDPRVMSDMIIGLSDGLTVPFALTAGLSSLGDSKLVITGGFAELVSGAISMGLGGYLAAKSESQYYHNEVSKEKQSFYKNPNELEYELMDILEDIGIHNENTVNLFIDELEKKPKQMVDFIIRFGKGLEEPADNRQLTSALTIGLSYFLGGFIPLVPYFFVNIVQTGLIISCIVMAVTLFIFGYVKIMVSMGTDCGTWLKVSEGFQMLFVGGFAATSAWVLVRLIEV